jgi:hypothetical protein
MVKNFFSLGTKYLSKPENSISVVLIKNSFVIHDAKMQIRIISKE